jgi:hypothetical protein
MAHKVTPRRDANRTTRMAVTAAPTAAAMSYTTGLQHIIEHDFECIPAGWRHLLA